MKSKEASSSVDANFREINCEFFQYIFYNLLKCETPNKLNSICCTHLNRSIRQCSCVIDQNLQHVSKHAQKALKCPDPTGGAYDATQTLVD